QKELESSTVREVPTNWTEQRVCKEEYTFAHCNCTMRLTNLVSSVASLCRSGSVRLLRAMFSQKKLESPTVREEPTN
ncbi:hypothetical protein PMAYCL1PPCAC_21558, partial [Pristionchus mayeri]